MSEIKAREIEICDVDGYMDPLGHNVCLKIITDNSEMRDEYKSGRLVRLVLCERGWCEEDHEPVPVTRHELAEIIRELQLLHGEMADYPMDKKT